MKKFKVFLRGENFIMRSEGEVKRLGFYTTRFVEAEDQNAAEECALDLLRQHRPLRDGLLNDREDPPKLFAEEIEELASFSGIENLSPVRWYPKRTAN